MNEHQMNHIADHLEDVANAAENGLLHGLVLVAVMNDELGVTKLLTLAECTQDCIIAMIGITEVAQQALVRKQMQVSAEKMN